ncbi:MAG: hypothetical protein AN484_09420 [Aphanizomenon flos-aquae WA102]|uniref:Uncharacterized protein n=1 Tax=Aphanizomenon flos-aquae WA102 TaxID=1710896 RepID=A0A1B7X3L8_APHFL|nr:MAG: hypothetical protein AN484_09420 [Aphanizomenon flos-aquae WA102]
MKKPLTAKKLLNFLINLENDGHDISKVLINYRFDSDSDVHLCKFVMEDLFDTETNNILESICLVSDASDYL